MSTLLATDLSIGVKCLSITGDMVPAGVAIKLLLRDYVRPGNARGADSAQLLTPTIVRVERS